MGFPTQQEILEAKCKAAQSKLYEGITLLGTMERNIDTEIESIQREVRERNSKGDKSGSMAAFRSLKLKEKERDHKRQMRTTLESQYNTIQTSQFSGELHRVLSECNGVLKGIAKTTNIDAVQSTMDDLEDIFSETKEIADVMASPMGASLEEEAEIEEESKFELGGKSALESQLDAFLKTEPPKTSVPSHYTINQQEKTHFSMSKAPFPPSTNPFLEHNNTETSSSSYGHMLAPSNKINYNHLTPKPSISGKRISSPKRNVQPPSIYSKNAKYTPRPTTYRDERHV